MAEEKKVNKKKVGIFSFTSDEGCTIYLTEIFNKKLLGWLEKIELVYFLSIKDHKEIEDYDIAIVEGVLSSERDMKEVKKIREHAKIMIGIGNCTITGMPSGHRNNFNAEQMEEIRDDLKKFDFLPKCIPVKEAVKLDEEIMGCPMDADKFVETFEKYI